MTTPMLLVRRESNTRPPAEAVVLLVISLIELWIRNQLTDTCRSERMLIIVQVKILEAKNEGEKHNKNTDLKTNEKPDIYDNLNDGIFTNASYDDEGAVADFTNLETIVNVSPIPTSRIYSIHPSTQILGDPKSIVQTRSKLNKSSKALAFVSYIQKQRRNNHKDFQHCLFACFLSQIEPKKISEALEDESWVDAMQEELLQFKIQKVWILVDLPYGKKVYKVVKALYGLHQAPRAWYATLSTFLLKSGYRRGTIDKTLFIKKDKNDIILQVKQKEDGIFISYDKYVAEILKKFDFASVKTASTPIEKPIAFGQGRGFRSYSDSVYARAKLERKSQQGGVNFLDFEDLFHGNASSRLLWLLLTTEADYGFVPTLWESFVVLKIHTDVNVADLLTKSFNVSSSIHFALTVSPIVSTSFVEQFWTSAKSRTVNNISYIDAIIAGKPVTISEASIRSDLLFDDADGIDTLNNQAIFEHYLRDVPVPMDHFPVPALTKKVLTFMVKKGKNFSGNVTPLFNSMLVQPTEDEGEVSERPSESQPIPSPTHPSEDQPESQPDPSPRPSSSIPIPDSNPEGSGGNHGEIKDLKAQIKQLKKKARPVINHHKAWFRAARLKKQQKKKDMEKSKKRRSVSKQGRKAVKSTKGAPFVQTHTNCDGLDTDLEASLNEAMDYTLAQDEGKTDSKVEEPKTSSKTEELHLSGDTLVTEDKGSTEKGGSTKSIDLQQSTVKPDESTIKPDEGTDKQDEGTNRQVEGTAENKDQDSRESATPTAPTMTLTPTPIGFGNDETIAQVLVIMSQNMGENRMEIRKRSRLKNVEDIERPRPTSTRSVLTLKPLPKARLNADKILAEKVQEEEREKFTIEERAKLLHDTIVAQRRFLAQQRSVVIRNKLPLRTQLRNQMMTYLKHVGGKKHSDLKTKIFEEIHVLFEKKADSIKEESKEEEGAKKRKLGTRKKMKSRKRRFRQVTSEDDETNSKKENDELRLCLTIAPDEDKEVDYEILDKNWKLHGSSGVHTLMTEAGLVIHMLVEKKYPLRKKVLLQMLELKLESEEDSTMALELIRFVKKLIAELEPENSDGDEEDL
ncbi:ribonuclease H-like domain-containing protein [Tanacetum coccineum]